MAGVVEDDHPPRTGLGEGFRVVADQGRAQPPSLALGFIQVAQQSAFQIGKVFRRNDLEPKSAHHTLRRR
uniref:hypothetical protein n=1 Tax=uncultured Caulobacter sp. TaxID=158749 RepID=UPI0025D49F46|nr:hypothetical protein [uncultured Caulobacter sp.]